MTKNERWIQQLQRCLNNIPAGTELIISDGIAELFQKGSWAKHMEGDMNGWGMDGTGRLASAEHKAIIAFGEGG